MKHFQEIDNIQTKTVQKNAPRKRKIQPIWQTVRAPCHYDPSRQGHASSARASWGWEVSFDVPRGLVWSGLYSAGPAIEMGGIRPRGWVFIFCITVL